MLRIGIRIGIRIRIRIRIGISELGGLAKEDGSGNMSSYVYSFEWTCIVSFLDTTWNL